MKKQTEIILSISLIFFLLTGCAAAPTQTAIPGLAQTLAVRTMVARQGVTYFATATPTEYPTLTPVFQYISATSLPGPTSSPIPSLTPIGMGVMALQGVDVCKNKAEFVRDVTYPDNSRLKQGERFTKIWEVMNVGTCTWNMDYSLVFSSGDQMGGLSPKPIGVEVKPGEMLQISVDLIAPKNSGEYLGTWVFEDDEGHLFGTGLGKNDYLWVAIVIGSTDRWKGIFGGGGCVGGG